MEYLFTAYYNDGSFYQQNSEDKSIKEPDKRSCFYDIEHDKLVKFNLTNGKNNYSVNLLNGEITCPAENQSFIIKNKNSTCKLNNDTLIINHEQQNLKNYRIIYYRGKEVAINYEFAPGQREKIINYVLGWQALNENGENIQQTIQINI